MSLPPGDGKKELPALFSFLNAESGVSRRAFVRKLVGGTGAILPGVGALGGALAPTPAAAQGIYTALYPLADTYVSTNSPFVAFGTLPTLALEAGAGQSDLALYFDRDQVLTNWDPSKRAYLVLTALSVTTFPSGQSVECRPFSAGFSESGATWVTLPDSSVTPSAPNVTHLPGVPSTVFWDITADLLNGYFTWRLKAAIPSLGTSVSYASRQYPNFEQWPSIRILAADADPLAAGITSTPTYSPTPTQSPTPTMSATPSHSPTPTLSATPSHSPTPTLSPTPTHSPTPSLSPSSTPTPSASLTPTPTPALSSTPTPSASLTPTPTPTLSSTPTPSASLTPTPIPTLSSTPTPSASLTPTPTPTLSSTPTPSASLTPTPTPTLSLTPTATPTLTPTPTPTPTPAPTPSPGHPPHTPRPSHPPHPSKPPHPRDKDKKGRGHDRDGDDGHGRGHDKDEKDRSKDKDKDKHSKADGKSGKDDESRKDGRSGDSRHKGRRR